MKHKLTISAAILLISAAVTCTAYAHAGSTDASGGHYDHDTGEYHYHHGYPAHQHENGTCPYGFDDKTGQNSGTSSGSTSAYDGFVRPEHTPEPTLESNTKQNPVTSDTRKNILFVGGGTFALFSAVISHNILQKRKKKQAVEEAERRRRAIEEERYPSRPLCVPIIPQEHTSSKEPPTRAEKNISCKPKTYCTVYVTRNGRTYHRYSCSCLNNSSKIREIDLFQAMRSRTPCERCKPPIYSPAANKNHPPRGG